METNAQQGQTQVLMHFSEVLVYYKVWPMVKEKKIPIFHFCKKICTL